MLIFFFFFFFVPPVSVLREINFKYNKFIIFIRVIILKLKCINHSNSKIVINLAKKRKRKKKKNAKKREKKRRSKCPLRLQNLALYLNGSLTSELVILHLQVL